MFLEGIKNKYAGKIRDVEVYISGSPYKPPMPDELPNLMLELDRRFKEVIEEKKESLEEYSFPDSLL